MKATLTRLIDQQRHDVSFSRAGRGRDLEVDQQSMPIFHERLTHIAEASFLPTTLAIQPRIGIGQALVRRIRSFLTMEIDPAIVRTATIRPLRGRWFVCGPKALEAGGGFDQCAVHAEARAKELSGFPTTTGVPSHEFHIYINQQEGLLGHCP